MGTATAQSDSTWMEEGPPPATDQEVWLEGLAGAPLGSIVTGTDGDGNLLLEQPRVAGVPVPLPLKQDFKITYKVRDVRHEVRAVLVRSPGGGDPHFAARMTAVPTRLQRRQDVRVPAQLQVVLRDADAKPDPETGEQPPDIRCITANVSASGFLAVAKHEMTRGQTFQGILVLEQYGPMRVRCRAMWTAEDYTGKQFQAGMRILDIDAKDRRALVNWILERQRILRRRELGLD